jgi:biotin transport system substrate-specific component
VYEKATAGAAGPMVPAATRTVAGGLLGAAVIAALTGVGAYIVIPLFPVPITMQTLFVLLAGAAIGGRYGSLGQVFYVGLGVAGVPVFAGGAGGLAVLGGPTGGYLISFLAAPLVVAALLRGSRSLPRLVLSFTAGTVVIFAFGVAHLAAWYTGDLGEALRLGMVPFIPGAVFKIAAAASISRAYWALAGRG